MSGFTVHYVTGENAHAHAQAHTHTHTHTHARTSTHTHMHVHMQTGMCAACIHHYRQVKQEMGVGGGTIGDGNRKFRSGPWAESNSVVLSFELGFCCSIAYRVWEFIPCDRAQMGKSALPLEVFLLFWNPKCVGISRGMQ